MEAIGPSPHNVEAKVYFGGRKSLFRIGHEKIGEKGARRLTTYKMHLVGVWRPEEENVPLRFAFYDSWLG